MFDLFQQEILMLGGGCVVTSDDCDIWAVLQRALLVECCYLLLSMASLVSLIKEKYSNLYLGWLRVQVKLKLVFSSKNA